LEINKLLTYYSRTTVLLSLFPTGNNC